MDLFHEKVLEFKTLPLKSYNARYQDIGILGSGSFGSVTLAKIRSHLISPLIKDLAQYPGSLLQPLSICYKAPTDLVAIKTMNKVLKRPQDYSKVKEVNFILSVGSHFNLVQIIDVFIDRTSLKLHIVMETMDQNLYQLMKSRKNIVFSPKTLKSILTQLLAAILHIHKHLFFHRDVKPENILIMQAQKFFGSRSNIPPNRKDHPYIIKLADYGLARHVQNLKPYTAYVSTRWYRSPEILLRQSSYSFPVDIWAFGCVAVECATFIPLFPGSNELDQTDRVLKFLGSPKVLKNGHQSFGGSWDDAIDLAAKLQLRIDTESAGSALENVIFRSDFTKEERRDFFKVIKGCLTWNPYKRITAVTLCHMAYFKNTVVEIDTQKENINLATSLKSSSSIYERNTPSPASKSVVAYNNLSNNPHVKLMKSQLFAGISSSAQTLHRKPGFSDLKSVSPFAFGSQLPLANISNIRKSKFVDTLELLNYNEVFDRNSMLTLNNINDIDSKENISMEPNYQTSNKDEFENSFVGIKQKYEKERERASEKDDDEQVEEEEDYDEEGNDIDDELLNFEGFEMDNASQKNIISRIINVNSYAHNTDLIKNRNLIDEIDYALEDELEYHQNYIYD